MRRPGGRWHCASNAPPRSLAADLTGPSLPSGWEASRAGETTVYAQSSASAAAPNTSAVYEDRGGQEGGGWWTFGAYANAITTPFNHSSGSVWTYVGSPVVTIGAGTGPDGSATADQIATSGGGTDRDMYHGDYATTGKRAHSVWVKDGSPAPTAPGGIQASNLTMNGIGFGSGSSWRRIHASADAAEAHRLYPAGYDPALVSPFDFTQSGAVLVWGDQELNLIHDMPLVVGSTSPQTLRLVDPSQLSLLVNSGDFDLEGAFISRVCDDSGHGSFVPDDFYVFSAQTPDGILSLRFSNSGRIWTFTVRGVDVGTILESGFPDGLEIKWRVYYKPSTGKWGMRLLFNGVVETVQAGGAESGVANELADKPTNGGGLSTPTSFWLGSNLGVSGYLFAQHTSLKSYVGAVNAQLNAEFVFVGDSIVTQFGDTIDTAATVYTVAESRSRAGIAVQAVVGAKISDQLGIYNNGKYKGLASVKAFIIQIGVNNVSAGDSASTIETGIQSIIDAIRSGNPTAKIVLCKMTPLKSALTAGQYAVWQDVNTWITGGGPISVDAIVTANSDNLNDGTDNIATRYAYNNVHPNIYGRQAIGAAWRAALVSLGLL